MSIPGAILGLLSEGPMTGYEVAKRFEHSLARVWPARPNQIYAALNRLETEGAVAEVGREARNARRYAITEQGRAALVEWMLRPAHPERSLRFEPLLKANFAHALPPAQRGAWLNGQRRHWEEQIAWLDAQMKHLPPDPAAPRPGPERAIPDRRRAAEAGRAIYAAMLDWARRAGG